MLYKRTFTILGGFTLIVILSLVLINTSSAIEAIQATPMSTVKPLSLESISIYNANDIQHILNVQEQNSPTTSIDFNFDGRLLTYGNIDGSVYLWSFATRSAQKLEYDSPYKDQPIVDVAFSPRGDYVAAARPVLDALLWTVTPPEWHSTIRFQSSILCVAFNRTGNVFAYGGDANIKTSAFESIEGGGFVSLVNLDAGDTENPFFSDLYDNEGKINTIVFSPDGQLVVGGAGGGSSIREGGWIRIWDAATGELKTTLYGHEGSVNSLAFSPNGTILASASDDSTINFWDFEQNSVLLTLKGHSGPVNSISFSPDGTLLVSGGSDGTIQFWDTSSGNELAIITLDNATENPIRDVVFSPDGTMIASASEDGIIRLWGIPQ